MLQTVNDYIDKNLVHSIHVSERRSFRGCRRRHDWIYRDMWYPQTTAKPLEFGIAYHKAAEKWYDPDFWGDDEEIRKTETLLVFQRECESQYNSYKQKVNDGTISSFQTEDEVRADYRERVELGFGMLKQMFKTSAELDHGSYTPVGVEVKFEVPIEDENGNDLWCKCNRCWKKYVAFTKPVVNGEPCTDPIKVDNWNGDTYKYWKGLPVTYGGRIDMLAQDINGRYWVFDWKTAARLSTGEPGSPDDYLQLDDQITSYCWALWSLGIDVAGFIYHEQKKSVPEEPEPLKRLNKGCMYSQNRQKDFDYEVYKKTVQENDPQAFYNGLYDEFLEHLQNEGSPSYKRHEIKRNEHELRNCGISIAMEAAEITDPNLRIYHSPGRFSCNFCAFKEPCLAKNRGEDYLYTLESLFEKREKLYYETAEASTDKPDRV